MRTNEEWRHLRGVGRGYSVSNYGSVRRNSTGRIVSPSYAGQYLKVSLQLCKGRWKTVHVHRLVARAWVPGYLRGRVVNHKNGIREDNSAANLEWVTCQENTRHAFRSGLTKTRKLTDDQAKELRNRYANGETFASLGRAFGISNVAARNIAIRKVYLYQLAGGD